MGLRKFLDWKYGGSDQYDLQLRSDYAEFAQTQFLRDVARTQNRRVPLPEIAGHEQASDEAIAFLAEHTCAAVLGAPLSKDQVLISQFEYEVRKRADIALQSEGRLRDHVWVRKSFDPDYDDGYEDSLQLCQRAKVIGELVFERGHVAVSRDLELRGAAFDAGTQGQVDSWRRDRALSAAQVLVATVRYAESYADRYRETHEMIDSARRYGLEPAQVQERVTHGLELPLPAILTPDMR